MVERKSLKLMVAGSNPVKGTAEDKSLKLTKIIEMEKKEMT